MLTTTLDAARSLLKTDQTLTQQERQEYLARWRFSETKQEAPSQPAAVLKRNQAAGRLNRSPKFVDKLAAEGLLEKVRLPGRQRACGITEASLVALVNGRHGSEVTA